MKLFAFYLPQFHEIVENNIWWGKGFTEWTHVKAARQLCKNHVQPIHPLNDNYYNLLDEKTVQWQDKLLEEYQIDGLVYYHYYFRGKMLLEKPAENLRISSSKRKYFFCWANHSWFKASEGKKTLLIEQTYGVEKDWEEHFQYLLSFFEDERYEKRDNKPLLMIFDSSFKEKKKMFKYWNQRCIEEGFDGIHIIETYGTMRNAREALADSWLEEKSVFLREPSYAKLLMRKNRPFTYLGKRIGTFLRCKFDNLAGIETYSGDLLFKLITKEYEYDKNIYHGLCFSWDNTPRHGKRGFRIIEPDKNYIFRYLNQCKNDEYVFINAWNEWAEGMILEPTEENGYKYLEWIKEWKDMNDNK